MWVRVWNSISWIQNMADQDSGPAGLWAVPVYTLDLTTCCMGGARAAAPPSRVGVLLCAEWVRHSPALRGLQASRPHLPRQLWPYRVTPGTTEVDRARGLDPLPPRLLSGNRKPGGSWPDRRHSIHPGESLLGGKGGGEDRSRGGQARRGALGPQQGRGLGNHFTGPWALS